MTQHNDISTTAADLGRAFHIAGPLERLPHGEGRTYRAGTTVYRRESDDTEATHLADVYQALAETDFRIPRPVRTKQGMWVSPEGWSAWTFVAGRAATVTDVPAVITAITAFHRALAQQPYPSYLAQRNTPFDRADQAAWGTLPDDLDSQLVPFMTRLQRFRHAMPDLPAQLIHGDLNEENIRIAPDAAPAIIDLTPYWHPAAFALAVFAY